VKTLADATPPDVTPAPTAEEKRSSLAEGGWVSTTRTADTESSAGERALEGEIEGQTFKQGQRILVCGIAAWEGREAVITGVGTGKRAGQLYIRCGKRSIRIWAKDAKVIGAPLEDISEEAAAPGAKENTPPPSFRGDTTKREGFDGYKYTFGKGMRVRITGLAKYEGKEAVVTGVGTGQRKNQIHFSVDGHQLRIWMENATAPDVASPPRQPAPEQPLQTL